MEAEHGEDALEVDPDFELYSGIERNESRPVPLEIALYAETPAFEGFQAGGSGRTPHRHLRVHRDGPVAHR